MAKEAATLIARLLGLRNQKRTHLIRVIIDATSTTDLKTRSRWTRALRYAWRERKAWTDLKRFLRETAGLPGARKSSLLSSRRAGIRAASFTGAEDRDGRI